MDFIDAPNDEKSKDLSYCLTRIRVQYRRPSSVTYEEKEFKYQVITYGVISINSNWRFTPYK
jgi:phosphotransferase system IIB component